MMLAALLMTGCGAGTLRRPAPAVVTAPPLSMVVEGGDELELARLRALLDSVARARGLVVDAAAERRLVVDLVAWRLEGEPRVLRAERWADDGGPTGRRVETLWVRELVVELVPRWEPAAVGDLAPVAMAIPAQVGAGRDELLRVRREPEPVLVLRGDEAGISDRGMRLALADLLDQVAPPAPAGGGVIPLATGGGSQSEALRLARAGDLAAAEVLLRAAVEVAPGDAAASYNLAAVLDAQGRFAEAVERYGAALALRPDPAWQATAAAAQAALAASRR